MSDHVTIYEVGPRDGLQNEQAIIAAVDKVRLINLLSDCGLEKIEVTSFVNPKWVPQMADAAEVMAAISRKPGVTYAVLTPNLKGYAAAKAAHADEVAVFASASEGFSKANINCSIAESIERFKPVCESAANDRIPVRGYVSCVIDCPYDGPTAPEEVAKVVEALVRLGCHEISLGDTIGSGTPAKVDSLLAAILAVLPAGMLAAHFHDTHNRALDNVSVALERGLRVFDSSVAGLGGCPYAPGAKGNVSTARLIERVESLGCKTDVDFQKLKKAEVFALLIRNQRAGAA